MMVIAMIKSKSKPSGQPARKEGKALRPRHQSKYSPGEGWKELGTHLPGILRTAKPGKSDGLLTFIFPVTHQSLPLIFGLFYFFCASNPIVMQRHRCTLYCSASTSQPQI